MRERVIAGICAQRRSGKTTLTSLLARLANARARMRVVDPSGNLGCYLPEDLDGWIAKIVSDNERAIRERKPVPVSLVVFDDADAYLPRIPKPGSPWQKLYLCSAQLDLDVIWNAKRLANVSPSLLNSTTWLYVGRIPRADVSGRDRTVTVLSEGDIPTEPFHWVQVDPNGDQKYRLRTVKRSDGSTVIEYLK